MAAYSTVRLFAFILLLLASSSVLECAGGREFGLFTALSAHKTKRLDRADHQSLKWNAAVVKSPDRGWVAVAVHNSCYWGADGCAVFNTGPWVAFMGTRPLPEQHLFEQAGSRWTLDEESYMALLPRLAGEGSHITEDYRVFSWKGSLYMNAALHSFGHLVRPDQDYNYYPALLRMDMETKSAKLEHVFKERLDGSNEPPGIEKNWGFFERDGRLLILYQTFPCTIVYEFDDHLHTLARLVSKKCYAELESKIKDLTHLSLTYSHNSANPVVWERNGESELLAVVHNRNTDTVSGYNHWLVRLDYHTFAVTHISHGVIFGAALSYAGGHLRDAILVGSVTIVKEHGDDFVYIAGGEGDTHSVYSVTAMSSIQWLPFSDLQEEVSASS